eukprot:3535609-Amphidinium_carterae.1
MGSFCLAIRCPNRDYEQTLARTLDALLHTVKYVARPQGQSHEMLHGGRMRTAFAKLSTTCVKTCSRTSLPSEASKGCVCMNRSCIFTWSVRGLKRQHTHGNSDLGSARTSTKRLYYVRHQYGGKDGA